MNDAPQPLPPQRLVPLLEPEIAGEAWTPADAAAALRHQLLAPLVPDLAAMPGADLQWLEVEAAAWQAKYVGGGSAADLTFGTLLNGPSPVESLLDMLKQWARWIKDDAASPLAGGPATVLYYAAIAAGLLHLDKRLTTLSDEQLRAGFEWSIRQPGAETLRQQFDKAGGRLKSRVA